MHRRGTLLILILALTAQVRAGRIIGGREAAPHSRPYMVLVERNMSSTQTLYCGGFLLREDFVMTAAHCAASSYIVKMGLHDVRNRHNVQSISVKEPFSAEDYDDNTFFNDILLLKLSSNAELNSKVSTIALAVPEDADPKVCSVAGWGRSENFGRKMTPFLMEVNVTLEQCDEKPQNDYLYCSKGRSGVGEGDSGGPLVCENGKVYGVVSAKDETGNISHLFAKVQKHTTWITSTMNSH